MASLDFSRQYRMDGRNDGLARAALGLVVAALVIGFLYVGKEAFQPLVIAALLSFILAPSIRRLRVWGLGKATSVLLVVFIAVGALGGLAFVMAKQVTELAGELPQHETNLRAKLQAFKGTSLSTSALEKASDTLRKLEEEISRPSAEKPAAASPVAPNFSPAAQKKGPEPILVEVRQPQQRTLESLQQIVHPLMSPLATTGLIILFLLFILMQREDLRDRMLRLFGTTDLRGSTEAMNDAAARLSRFFVAQAALNIAFGVVIGIGLWVIGVPNAVLWGMLAAVMRFVPYVGAVIAAVFPIALAAAVDPGWTMVAWTAALFIVGETLAGHVVEPMLYGHHTGLSPVAVVVATLFWTLLWGPIGLLLATPLTVCLVVLGRHIDAMTFIEVLLGDQPALTPEQSLYQRLLAGDANEAADNAEQILKTAPLSAYYSNVAMKGLSLAHADAASGKLSREEQAGIASTIKEIVLDLADYEDVTPLAATGLAAAGAVGEDGKAVVATVPAHARLQADTLAPAWTQGRPVLCIAGRSALDEAAGDMLGHVLEKHGLAARVHGALASSERLASEIVAETKIVCISYFGATASPVLVRYLIRRLRRVMPNAVYVAAFWTLEPDSAKAETWRKDVGADHVATSIEEAAAICMKVPDRVAAPVVAVPVIEAPVLVADLPLRSAPA